MDNLKINGYRTAISIVDSKVGNDVSLETQRKNILLSNFEFGSKLTAINYRGDIEGTIQGAMADYSITSIVYRGENNLPNDMPGGDKQIHVEVSRGDISIDFTND